MLDSFPVFITVFYRKPVIKSKSNRMTVFTPAIKLFTLHKLPWSDFNFPRWQAWAVIVVIGLLIGLDPAMRHGTPDMPAMPLLSALLCGLVSTLAMIGIVIPFLKWWMMRGGRLDWQGNMFNLLATSFAVTDILGAGLVALGVPLLLTLPIWIYSVWVGANALSGANPKVSLSYSICGIVLAAIPVMVATTVLMVVFRTVMGSMVLPMPFV